MAKLLGLAAVLVVAGGLLLVPTAATAQSITLTMTTLNATGGGVYSPTTAVAGEKFIVQINVTQMQAGLTVIGYSVKWDPTEVALTAFTDGRLPYDGKDFGPAGTNALTVGAGACGTCELYAGNGSSMPGGPVPLGTGISSVATFEALAETLGVNQINNMGMFSAAPISNSGMGFQFGAIAQISFEVLSVVTDANFDIEVFFRAGLDVVGTSAGTDLTSSVDLTGANVSIGGTAAIPEPATLFLLGSGLAGLAGFGRRRRSP